MGRAPCCDKANVKKGPWSPEEDAKLKDYIDKYGTGGNWIALPHKAGLRRCGKSCRLRWLNYLRPNIKHGDFTDDEDRVICSLFASIGSRWSIIAAQLPGRTDNDIKNYWNTKLKKKLMGTIPSSSSQKRILQSTTVPAYLSSASLAPSVAHTWPGVIGDHEAAANYYYTTQGQLQAGLIDNLSLISSHLFNNTTTTTTTTTTTSSSSSLNTAAQEGYNYSTSTTSSMQNYQVQDMSFLRFGNGGGGGGDQATSCSSDGSSTYDYSASNVVNINNNNNNDNNLNMNINYFGSNYVADNPLDDSLEEIKQLISTTNLCNNLFLPEIKTEEKIKYY